MNHFMDYVCRGIVRSEDAIRCLNKRVVKLAKCNSKLGTGVICLGVAGLLLTAMVAIHDQEIQALRKQVAELAKSEDTTTNATEEQNQQEGA